METGINKFDLSSMRVGKDPPPKKNYENRFYGKYYIFVNRQKKKVIVIPSDINYQQPRNFYEPDG